MWYAWNIDVVCGRILFMSERVLEELVIIRGFEGRDWSNRLPLIVYVWGWT